MMRTALLGTVSRMTRALPPLRGRGRIAHIVHRHSTVLLEETAPIEMHSGYRMLVPMGSLQSLEAAFTGTYDDEEVALIRPFVETKSLVLDIGASLGFYTIPLALTARAVGAYILAIDPVEANCEIIRRNVALNQLQAFVGVLPVALGRSAGEMTIHVEAGGAGNASIVGGIRPDEMLRHDRAGRTTVTEQARVCSLDKLVLPSESHGRRCSLIKMDVEGFEMEVLLGAGRFLTEHRPAILGEFNQEWLRSRDVAPSLPQTWASESGYRCFEVTRSRRRVFSDRQDLSLKPLGPEARRTAGNLLLLIPK